MIMVLYIIRTIALFIGYFFLSLLLIGGLIFTALLVKGIWNYIKGRKKEDEDGKQGQDHT